MIKQKIYSNNKDLLIGYLHYAISDGWTSLEGVVRAHAASDYTFVMEVINNPSSHDVYFREDVLLTERGRFKADEALMSIDELKAKYDDRHQKDHVQFDLHKWTDSAIYDRTRLGYWEWVKEELLKAKAVKEEAKEEKEEARVAAIVEKFSLAPTPAPVEPPPSLVEYEKKTPLNPNI